MQFSASLADVVADAGAHFSTKEKQSTDRLSDHLKSNLRYVAALAFPRMMCRSQFPGINRHPKDPARYCSRIMHLEATCVRSSPSAGHAWSAQSREAVGGSMMLFQVE